MALVVKNPPANAGDITDVGLIPGLRRSLGGQYGTHSSILSWKILCTEESGELQSMGSKELDTTEQLSTHPSLYYSVIC